MSTERMPIPVRKSPKSNDLFVTYVHFLATCLTDNTGLPNPTPSPQSLHAQADALAQANADAKSGGPGLVADRDDKREDLEGDLEHLLDYVRGVIKAQGLDPAAARKLILSAGLSIRKSGKSTKHPLTARHGILPGEVVLVARAVAPSAMYFWEYSLDQVNWTSVPPTMRARTMIAGLTPGQAYFFRFRAQSRKGLGPYADAVRCRAL